jgi:hypothetical protein
VVRDRLGPDAQVYKLGDVPASGLFAHKFREAYRALDFT